MCLYIITVTVVITKLNNSWCNYDCSYRGFSVNSRGGSLPPASCQQAGLSPSSTPSQGNSSQGTVGDQGPDLLALPHPRPLPSLAASLHTLTSQPPDLTLSSSSLLTSPSPHSARALTPHCDPNGCEEVPPSHPHSHSVRGSPLPLHKWSPAKMF